MQINYKIITPEALLAEGQADELIIPTKAGDIGVLARHVSMISALRPGEIKIKTSGKTDFYAIGGGFLEVVKEGATILADSAEHAENIDIARAEEARRQAERLMKEAKEDVEYADAEAWLERNIARLKVAQRKKSHHYSGHHTHSKSPENIQ